MQTVQSLGPFRGLYSALSGNAPQGFAGALLNVRVGDGWLRPRYGFRNLAGKPSGLTDVYGFARLLGYGDDYLPRLEWVSVETRSGVTKPYAVDPSTWARTEITNGGSPLALAASDWLGFVFGGTSYWVNPGGATSLYRHEVGDVASWSPLQNATYAPVGDSPSVTAQVQQFDQRAWLPTTTDTYAHAAVGSHGITKSTTFAIGANGSLLVSGSDDDDGDSNLSRLTIAFATTTAVFDADYCAMVATAGGTVLKNFDRGNKVEVMVGGAWIVPEQFETRSGAQVAVVFRMRGVTGATAVQGVRLTLAGDPYSGTSGLAYTVSPLIIGGTYLGATAMGNRSWSDSPYKTRAETYGVRYRNVSTGAYTGIRGATLTAEQFGTQTATPGGPVGDRLLVTADPDTQSPYVDDPAGTSYRMEFVRQDASGVWRVLGDAPNTVGQSLRDRREIWQLSSLPMAAAGDYVPPSAPPVFSSAGFVGGVPFKGWVVWFRSGGLANVQHSRVGDPESLYSPGDDSTTLDGNPEDLARGANFTLADDQADEPVGGVQAGQALLILGREGAYGQTGDSPSTMTPPRKAPGSMGVAGRYAFARYRSADGTPGVAWLDRSGENVWFLGASTFYSTDVTGRPVELSQAIRGTLRRFLLTDQIATLPGLGLDAARMDVDEATGSLWVVLGGRAAILRPPSLADGSQDWELSSFALGAAGTTPIPGSTSPYPASAFADVARPPATLAWTNPSFALPGSDVATVGTFAPGLSSHWLSGTGFWPTPTLVPAEATVTGLKAVVRHRLTSTGTAPCPAILSAAQSGTLSLTPNRAVPSAFEDYEIDLSGLLPLTPAQLNAGLPFQIAYDAVPGDPNAFDPSRWTPNYEYAGAYHNASGPDVSEPSDGPWPESPQGGERLTSQTGISGAAMLAQTQGSVNVRFAYTAGAPPPYAVYLVHSKAVASETRLVSQAHAVDNGLGVVVGAYSQNGDNEFWTAESTRKVMASLTGYTVATSAQVSGPATNAGSAFTPGVTASVRVDAAVANPDPSTVEVESVTMVASYTVPVAEGSRSIAYLAFGQRSEGLVWLRSSGHLDAAEWCPTCSAYVEGTGRDGGLTMPEGYWESARMDGTVRRLDRTESERESFAPLSFVAYTERRTQGEGSTAAQGRRWNRFSPRVEGRTHRIRVRVPETLTGVSSLDMVFNLISGPRK